MPTIKPVSDLRNYNAILREVGENSPVFLTKNGVGRYALLDIKEYEKQTATIKLLSELKKGEASVKKESDWLSGAEVEKRLSL
ncbi:antitoxin [Candidatus Termititenax aidoneus]|uniref:Antitoxin n=1 Tax=Termititenax aidoneus TaxID=2218524 RepID=A0A388TDX1_TERA1|nr:antitoxin [Candidatus Termititenax aidoneus]